MSKRELAAIFLHHCTFLVCRTQERGAEAATDPLLRWGADETALDRDGKTPAEVLDVPREGYPSQNEIDRVRLLLARAPADTARRRRGWLVMLRSRASMAETPSREGYSPSRQQC